MMQEAQRLAVIAAAQAAGFHLAGVAPAPVEGDAASERLQERFDAWATAGRAAEMGYLVRQTEDGAWIRSSVHHSIPWARSVVMCAFNYNHDAPRSIDPAPADTGWIARYAWSGTGQGEEALATDYHESLLERIKQLEMSFLQIYPEARTRCYVDTGPIVERHFAAVAGLGWTGKNTCLIHQSEGSWVLLAALVTSVPLAPTVHLDVAADRCGSCTRCIDACPTDALVAPRQMDAGLCIAYLTIEKKGSIAEDLRPKMGRQVFGCDICQDVCPWNRKAPIGTGAGMETRHQLVNPELQWLASMDNAMFKQWFRASPLERTGRKRLQRNVAIAMGNSGNREHLEQLERWATAEDLVLAETAQWAIEKIQKAGEEDSPLLASC